MCTAGTWTWSMTSKDTHAEKCGRLSMDLIHAEQIPEQDVCKPNIMEIVALNWM